MCIGLETHPGIAVKPQQCSTAWEITCIRAHVAVNLDAATSETMEDKNLCCQSSQAVRPGAHGNFPSPFGFGRTVHPYYYGEDF